MTQSTAASSGREFRSGAPLPFGSLVAFLIAISAVILIALASQRALEMRSSSAAQVTQTLTVLERLESLLSGLKDAESGQRGFLLTGDEVYLDLYTAEKAALPDAVERLRELSHGNAEQQQRIDMLQRLSDEKIAEMEQTIAARRAGEVGASLAIMRTDRGKSIMDRIRELVATMDGEARDLLEQRQQAWQQAAQLSAWVTWGGSGLLLLLILLAGVMTSRDYRARELQNWVRSGQMGLSRRIQGEQRLEVLGDNVLVYLAGYLGAQVGAVYIAEARDRFRRVASFAIPVDQQGETLLSGEGLLGQAAKENRAIHVADVPEGYLRIGSGVGAGKPRELLMVPASVDGVVYALIEFGFFRRVTAADQDLLMRASESLGIAVRSAKDRSRLEELLEETQRQGEELQAQQEELRVNNEELEEQGRALKESQYRLENQQTELEQTNAQLEEQMQMLEAQRDDLARAQLALTDKATELEKASQYKSEFLANMSHELRTPLNSSLILAKLLADNKDGNLTLEQVKFAQTISSAGNDLLTLINDILDLSKIEAGQVEVLPESVPIGRCIDTLARTFDPVARQKGLSLRISLEPETPEFMETDAQRLGQILKNLLSNALKFTEKGEVSLRVYRSSEQMLAFVVRDTGIGIAADQQGIIFEAFRQADGSTHRKYGGTGLGLSISRDLARLLGGDISVHSVPGEGSAFTLMLPLVYTGATPAPVVPVGEARPASAPQPSPSSPPPPAAVPRPTPRPTPRPVVVVEDDRAHLTPHVRLLLVIEDDVRFAQILRDLSHEMGYQCVVTHSANEGVIAAIDYRPSAILLDMNLPDHSGLGVLDQLKRNSQTRHIPVHVISVADYSQDALERGAVGYALKPVRREQLIEAFQRLESKFSQSLKRVLVVEDDARQRESIHQLLETSDVHIVGVETAAQALAQLQASTFDCMVMDLNLPDLSGYELLERMAAQDEVSFPPVIVYTGRSLTREEEQGLRRFSRSIIIKDARSPERLLDEVTLFIHQVESKLPAESQRMLKVARDRDTTLEGRRILVVEDDVRNIFALSSVLEPKGASIEIARNGREAIDALTRAQLPGADKVDLVLMDIMMPEMDGFTAMREIRRRAEWKKLPIIALTAKAMKDDQEKCLAAGANDYIAKPLDVEKLLSLVRVWMPKS